MDFTLLIILYYLFITTICIKIILDTDTPSKAFAYLFLVVFFPIVGILFYFSFGINYRKRKLYSKKLESNIYAFDEILKQINIYSLQLIDETKQQLKNFSSLAIMVARENGFTTQNNRAEILVNGEQKFPSLIDSLKIAKNHIHIEYYIFEDDTIGNTIGDILIQKAQEGVKVRFIYDDFGSKSLGSSFKKRLVQAGVEIAPFYKIKLLFLINSLNYRNHRKIIIIDGSIGYVGGINISDKYINDNKSSLFWRDTHLKIEGTAVFNLQMIFLTDWNFCAEQSIPFSEIYFPLNKVLKTQFGNQLIQISASGPDSEYEGIMYALIRAIQLSKKEICLCTPYFIPEKSVVDALKIAHLSGVKVKILVPGVSDSKLVNAASNSNYEELLKIGIEVYKYQKGFVHAKTLVCDEQLAIIGTANIDERSFDLNFEVNALIYNKNTANQLRDIFYEDLKNSKKIDLEDWQNRPYFIKVTERIIRLFSPLM